MTEHIITYTNDKGYLCVVNMRYVRSVERHGQKTCQINYADGSTTRTLSLPEADRFFAALAEFTTEQKGGR
jgi:hypothetical protein